MISKYKGVISLSFAIVFCSCAFGVPTLDQYQDNYNGTTAPMSSWKTAQTFTAGITGTLDHLEIGFTSTGPTTWEIWQTAGGAPDGTVLGGVTLPSSMTMGLNTIDMAPESIPINAGTMYAIVTYFPAGGYEALHAEFDPDSYTGGQLWMDFGSGWEVLSAFGGGDLQFRTYVETGIEPDPAPQPNTIPVPGAVILGGIGMAIVGLLRRNKTI
jgi:hypothetical protein